jgi:copper homeostasis protein
MLLEVACFKKEDLLKAIPHCDRIEYCNDYSSGGLTPSYEGLMNIIKDSKIPIFVMIRPRPGAFIIEDSEIKTINDQISAFIDIGVSGFVFGALKEVNHQNTIDFQVCEVVIESSQGLPCTFHRAFDRLPNPIEALKQIEDLGFKRILTSGGKGNAIDNVEQLKELTLKSNITILAGGGVRSNNFKKLLEVRVEEVHSACVGEDFHLELSELIELRRLTLEA